MLLFSFSVFVSAFLLFLVQPLIGRIILPWFGGTAAVWTTCLMFFQAALLLGYLYAHASVRWLTPRKQATVHAVLLGLSVLALPILPGVHWKPVDVEHPVWDIVVLLAGTVGIPYLLLSTTGPIVQAWFARTNPGRSPYRLYALSNAGSLMALVAYPALVEPAMRIGAQAYLWSAAYALFAVVCAALAIIVARRSLGTSAPSEAAGPITSPPGWPRYALWTALAFCPSALLVAITSHLTQNIAPVPLLWILPLSAYLLSLILTFDGERWYKRQFWFPTFVTSAAVLLAFLMPAARNASSLIVIPVFLVGFFICAVTCHGELYRLRPDSSHLTSFYLMISFGGALGGFFVGVIAPMVFHAYVEAAVALLGCVLLVAVVLPRDAPSLPGPAARYVEWGLLTALAGGFIYLLAFALPEWSSKYLAMERNFYGVLRVDQTGDTEDDFAVRELYNGNITHGSEYMERSWHLLPTTYYGRKSGVGLAIERAHSNPGRKIGVVGLGAGTLAAYGRPGDVFRFYEINPLVVQIARTRFFYLRETPANVDVVLGDARLSMEREPPRNYDVLAVDAFSGDSIPVHLLTVEAFREYFRHLKPNGILAVHVSNKYLDLPRIVSVAAATLRKAAIKVEDAGGGEAGVDKSDWILLASAPDAFDRPEWDVPGRTALPVPSLRMWTDDYSNLLSIVKWKWDLE